MPKLNESLEMSKALADAPTLGNLHPDARTQGIARASQAEGTLMAQRLRWLHSTGSQNVDGYEWGIYRVKWVNGKAVEVLQTNGDFSDLDAAIAGRPSDVFLRGFALGMAKRTEFTSAPLLKEHSDE